MVNRNNGKWLRTLLSQNLWWLLSRFLLLRRDCSQMKMGYLRPILWVLYLHKLGHWFGVILCITKKILNLFQEKIFPTCQSDDPIFKVIGLIRRNRNAVILLIGYGNISESFSEKVFFLNICNKSCFKLVKI